MAAVNNSTRNGTSSGLENIFRCVRLPVTVGNGTFCGKIERWQSRYSHNGLLAMVLIPTVISILVLCLRLWRSKSAIKETYKDIVKLEKHLFLCRKDKELTKRDSIISEEFEVMKIEFEIKDKELSCVERIFQWIGDKIGVTDFGLKIVVAKTFIFVKVVAYIKLVWEAIDVMLDCFLLYQLESGQIFDTMIHRNIHVSNAIYAFVWISLLIQLCSCDCCSLGHLGVLMNDLKSVMVFLFIGAPELVLEYFYMDKFVTRKTDWYLFVRSSIQFIMAVLIIRSALENTKRARFMKEEEYETKIKFFSYMMIPIALASMCRVIGSTYQYATGKINRGCFTFEEEMKVYQSPFDPQCMRAVDYLVIILTFTPLGVTQLIVIVILTWFRLNPNSTTLKKYFLD